MILLMKLTRSCSVFLRLFKKNPASADDDRSPFYPFPLGAALLSFRLRERRCRCREVFVRHQFTRGSRDYFSW
jgi:hypothetical protein